MKILGISGSIIGSKTRVAVAQVLNRIKERHPDLEVELLNLADYQLQFSDGRDFRDYEADTKTIIEKIMAADAYIIGTPTYQASIPGVLKNVFDLLPIDSFKDKVIGVVSTAGSQKHYLVVEQHLKPILNYMKAVVVSKYVFIEDSSFINNEIIDDEIELRLNHLADDTVDMITVLQEIIKAQEASFDF